MLLSKRKIRAIWYFLKFNGSLLYILGLSVWFGSLVFFGAGVAPVHFNLAEAWELTGTNPLMSGQPISPETIGGALTAASIQRLNMIEVAAALLMTVGLAMLWIPRVNHTKWLMLLTCTLAANIAIMLIYVFIIGERLFEIQQTVPLDFSISQPAEQSAVHKEFDALHQWYSNFTKANLVILFVNFVILSAQEASTRVKRLKFSKLSHAHFTPREDQ